ncbi:MAG: filamentous hemagglutinin N-terminal domain-containing protein [Candidatus Omnitrophica bacterium]|nr:filamentous hemagglutinin N-terminal domain-containing protein [Candidatus Omnitrophota bacterium]
MFKKILNIVVSVSFIMLPVRGYALPTGESVENNGGGTVTFDRSVADTLTVSQSAQRAIINYESFSIAQPELVHFNNPATGVTLNRVINGVPSEIFGRLTAQGQVFLINPSGILFGQGCSVNTAGLVASTLNINSGDFMAGTYNFYNGVAEGYPGAVVNAGTLSAPGGFVALLGPSVENTSTGVITNLHSVALAAGETMAVSLDANNIISVAVSDPSHLNPEGKAAGVINNGSLQPGYKALLTSKVMDGIFEDAINNAGVVAARDIEITANGDIVLFAGSRIQASAGSDDTSIQILAGQDGGSGNLVIDGAEIKAQSEGEGDASIILWADTEIGDAKGNIDISDSSIGALVSEYEGEGGGNGNAYVEIWSDFDITIDPTEIGALVANDGYAEVWIVAGGDDNSGDLVFTESEVAARVGGFGSADVKLIAGNYNEETLPGSTGYDEIIDQIESLHGTGTIALTGSSVEAAINYGDHAFVGIKAHDIDITDSFVMAMVEDWGQALVDIFAGDYDYAHAWWDYQNKHFTGGTLDVLDSGILASVGAGWGTDWETRAHVDLEGYEVVLDGSAVVAQQKGDGLAEVDVTAAQNYIDVGQTGNYALNGGELTIQNPVTAFTDDEGLLIIDTLPSVAALVGGEYGEAGIELTSGGYDTLTLNAASVMALNEGSGDAQVDIESGYYESHESESGEWLYTSHSFNDTFYGAELHILNGSSVSAQVTGAAGEAGWGDATVDIAGSRVDIDGSSVLAGVTGSGNAFVGVWGASSYHSDNSQGYTEVDEDSDYYELYDFFEHHSENESGSGGNIDIVNDSSVNARVNGSVEHGNARVEMQAGNINIGMAPRTIAADLTGNGDAQVKLQAAYEFNRGNSGTSYGDWEYLGYGETGYEPNILFEESGNSHEYYYGGYLNIVDSAIRSSAASPDNWNEALVELYAGGINIWGESTVDAQVSNSGEAEIDIVASYNYNSHESFSVEMTEDSDFDWVSHSFEETDAEGGYVGMADGVSVEAGVGNSSSTDSEADVFIRGGSVYLGNIPSTIAARVNGEGDAEVELWAGDYSLDSSMTAWGFEGSDEVEEWEGGGCERLIINGGNLYALDTSIIAEVTNNQNESEAEVYLEGEYINLISAPVTARITGTGGGEASVELVAAEDHSVAWSSDWADEERMIQGGETITVSASPIRAQTTAGDATVYFSTQGGLNFVDGSSAIARVIGEGYAGVFAYDKGNMDYWPEFMEDLISGLVDEDISYGTGPMIGPINIADSTILAEAHSSSAEDNTAVVGLATESELVLDNSSVRAQEDSGVAAVALYAGYELLMLDGSDVSAQSNDYLAAVVGIAGAEDTIVLDETSSITADGGAGYGVVALASTGSLYLPGTITASGDSDIMPMVEFLLNEILLNEPPVDPEHPTDIEMLVSFVNELLGRETGIDATLELNPQFGYGSGVLLASVYGDIVLGTVSADAVLAAALGMYGGGNIYQVQTGLVSAQLLVLLAAGDIGTCREEIIEDGGSEVQSKPTFDFEGPINTDVDILAAYSFREGDIFINEANSLEVGLYLPVKVTDSFEGTWDAFLGMSVAAADGMVSIVSQGDMIVNSILAPFSGVFLQSANGSIYAGKGWTPFSYLDLAYGMFGVDLSCMNINLSSSWWSYMYEIDSFAPLVFTRPANEGEFAPNVMSGGLSYFSAPHGTIGSGTPTEKDPAISGEIWGIVRPGVEAVTGKFPSPGIDLTRYTPPGLVYFYNLEGEREVRIAEGDEEEPYFGNQIWPESIADPEITSGNPLQVVCDAYVTEGDDRALPDWYLAQFESWEDMAEVTAALTLEIGPPIVPPPPNPLDPGPALASALQRDLRAYYELMSGYRFVSNEPATPTSFFGYRPLTPTDMTAFDDTVLDEGAYDFISDNLKTKKKLPAYLVQ